MLALQKKFLLALALILALQAGVNFIKYCSEQGRFGGDFISFWHAAQDAARGNGATLYDPEKLQSYLKIYDTAGRNVVPPIIYPPHTLLLLWPMGNLTYNQAAAFWALIPLLLYFALVFIALKRSELMNDYQGLIVVYAILLPFLSANVFSGETGTIIGVLFLMMTLCWLRHPVLAGICIALMTVKPQLGLLIPFALIASGSWRIIAATMCMIVVMFFVTTAWLGADVWAHYLQMTHAYSSLLIQGSHNFDKLGVGPYISLHGAGVPANIAALFQGIITLSVLAAIIQIFCTKDVERQDMRFALLACGTLLAAPNTMCYDTPLLAAAFIPFLRRGWRTGLSGLEIVALTLVIVMPYAQLITMPLHVPSSTTSLLLFFIILYRRYNLGRDSRC